MLLLHPGLRVRKYWYVLGSVEYYTSKHIALAKTTFFQHIILVTPLFENSKDIFKISICENAELNHNFRVIKHKCVLSCLLQQLNACDDRSRI